MIKYECKTEESTFQLSELLVESNIPFSFNGEKEFLINCDTDTLLDKVTKKRALR